MERIKITENIVQLSQEGQLMPACLTAFFGEDGLLLVDAGMSAQADALKETIRELGYDTPAYIVNTHAHPGNVGGNGAFGEAPNIIAHRGVTEQMQSDTHILLDLPEAALPDLEIDTDMTLRFNGERVRIIPMPGSHTAHDIIVHFVDSGVACIGDIYPGRFFTTAVYGGRMENLPARLRRIIELLPEDTKLLYGHQPGIGKMDDLREMLAICDETYPLIVKGIQAGKSREELEAILPKKWSDVGIPGGQFGAWLFCLNRDLQASEESEPERASILRPMFEAQKTGNGEAAAARVRELIGKGLTIVPRHEFDLLQFAYWLLLTKELPEDALQVFKLGIELFPDAWNTHDSLAEAYAVLGQRDLAIAHYNKSLELSPENDNAVTELAKLGVDA